ncbi:hypothetical protein SAMN05519103_00745 [Rhizobiales bacterium GAS113]|nr:hypothetical protein SAMN05519103_00745 [Rhizobiales bacterium GAS113]
MLTVTSMNALAIHGAFAAVCPIDGVAGPMPAGSPGAHPASDGSLWRLDFSASATSAQRQAAIAALAAYVAPAPAREATGKQLCAALSDLGVLAAWDAAVMASTKPEDRIYWLNAYRNLVPENNPKIGRMAKAANVNMATLFTKALTEPAS